MEILQRDYISPGHEVPEDYLTGVNVPALARAASHALSIDEVPLIAFENKGGFNTLFRMEFPSAGRKLVARIPLREVQDIPRIEAIVATMSFARYVRGIPTPRVFAWNSTRDNPVGTPYIIQEYVGDVVEVDRVWGKATDGGRSRILDELARWHAAFLSPLPASLQGAGDLGFAPDLPWDADLSDPGIYIIKPLRLLLQRLGVPPRSFQASSTSLSALWHELWSYHRGLCLPVSGSSVNREELDLEEDDLCDVVKLRAVVEQVPVYYTKALRLTARHPRYVQSCLWHSDYAYRNILMDPQTFEGKAFIDWDDVHIMPFVISLNFPQNIMWFSTLGLPDDHSYYREGDFPCLPPDQYGEIVGAIDVNGNLTGVDANGKSNGVDERDERIRNTRYRERFIATLGTYDRRILEDDMWTMRTEILKSHHLLIHGGSAWWRRRQWIGKHLT